MILYKIHKEGLFNGFVTEESGSTIEAQVKLKIIGETAYDFITRIIECEIPYWDENGRYKAQMCTAIGIHKSRLIKWIPTQLIIF